MPTSVRRSDVLPIVGSVEGPSLEAVPVIAVARDDLAWFAFEAETNALLAMIDGHSPHERSASSWHRSPSRPIAR